jgi:hypothetical protein
MEQTLAQYSQDFQKHAPRLKRLHSSLMTKISVTSLHAQQISVLLFVLQFIFIYQTLDNTRKSSKQSQISTMFRLEELMENTLKQMIIFTTFPIRGDLA